MNYAAMGFHHSRGRRMNRQEFLCYYFEHFLPNTFDSSLTSTVIFTPIRTLELKLDCIKGNVRIVMRKNRNLGKLFSPILSVGGAFLINESTAHSQWYMDIYLIAGAIVLATGLIIACWNFQQYYSIRRLEQHLRRRY